MAPCRYRRKRTGQRSRRCDAPSLSAFFSLLMRKFKAAPRVSTSCIDTSQACGVLPSGNRTIDPDCCRFRVAGAYRNDQAVERRHEQGSARPAPRCDPSHWCVIGPRIKYVDGALPAGHVNALALAIEKDVVDVTARAAVSNWCSCLHIAHAKLRRISERNNRSPSTVIECHSKIAAIFAGGPELWLTRPACVSITAIDCASGRLTNTCCLSRLDLKTLGMGRQGNVL